MWNRRVIGVATNVSDTGHHIQSPGYGEPLPHLEHSRWVDFVHECDPEGQLQPASKLEGRVRPQRERDLALGGFG